jgi:hypothetical protein
MTDSLAKLGDTIDAFVAERDWAQFHTPKNLAMSVAIGRRADGTLPGARTPISPRLDPAQRKLVAQEMGDVLIYLVRLSRILDIDLVAAAAAKLELNRVKYPIEKAKGRATVRRSRVGAASYCEISARTAGHAITANREPRAGRRRPSQVQACLQCFSAKKSTTIAAIHIRFMSPTTTSTAITAQQQPGRVGAVDRAARSEPVRAAPKSCETMNASGLWQPSRQTRFHDVN